MSNWREFSMNERVFLLNLRYEWLWWMNIMKSRFHSLAFTFAWHGHSQHIQRQTITNLTSDCCDRLDDCHQCFDFDRICDKKALLYPSPVALKAHHIEARQQSDKPQLCRAPSCVSAAIAVAFGNNVLWNNDMSDSTVAAVSRNNGVVELLPHALVAAYNP